MPFSLSYLVSMMLFGTAFWAYAKVNELKKRKENSEVVTATVTHKEVLDGKYGAYRYWLHYVFDVAGRTVVGKAEVSAGMYEQIAVDNTIPVMVERHNADVNYLQKVFLDRLSSYQALLMLLVASGIIVPIVF